MVWYSLCSGTALVEQKYGEKVQDKYHVWIQKCLIWALKKSEYNYLAFLKMQIKSTVSG